MTPLDATLLAIGWGASLVALRAPGVPFGAGFLVATALAAVVLARTLARSSSREALARSPWLRASLVVLVAHAVPAALTASPLTSWLAVARLGLVLVFATLTHVHAGSPLREGFSRAGALFLAVLGASLVLGLTVPSVRALVFVAGAHQHVGSWGRFAALTDLPATTGLWALVVMGAARAHPDARVKIATTITGLLVAVASLSIATLAVPLVLASGLVENRRARAIAMIAAALLAVTALWVHPLSVRVGEHEITISTLHAGWHRDTLGAIHQPVHVSTLGPVALEWHATAYALLAERAITCALEHPVTGVGPARFAERCPVMTMNTYGEWTTSRRAHHQLGAWMAELGVLGLALLALAARVLAVDRARLAPLDRWQWGSLAALGVGLFSGEIVETIPVLAWLALVLAPIDAVTPSARSPDRAERGPASGARSDAT